LQQERAMPLPSRPSILDIARAAGVSPVLVSSVVAGRHSAPVNPDIAQRVRTAMASLGYGETDQPDREPRRSRRALMLVCRMGSTYSRMLVDRTQAALAEHRLSLTVQEGEGVDPIRRAARMIDDGIMDGLIVETDDETAETLRDLAATGHPIVAIGPKSPGSGHDVVTADDSVAIRDAMLHLVDRRYERFLLVSPRSDSNRDYRTTVARDQLRALGVPPDHIDTIYSDHDPVAAFRVLSPALQPLGTPLAIVSGSDSCAIGALWACLRAGLRVPEDIAVLGHGNSPDAEITFPALSTIGPERSGLRRAADLLAERIEQPSLAGRHIAEPWTFIPRDST
jgi:DNA-binding LacI/PurR family transcriptional regulator